ncbi:FecR family protein [Steroidobacter sp.]|uniref:FecR family protein n=1 Tax=Steroidobacter sp. TaxID=1978227 RepID=UPI001A59DF0E|nr:FecR domain-containing protein [Steroidobacter sp.]MBL8267812.1 FecR domain-containing protein [Steroidobacter sp.]
MTKNHPDRTHDELRRAAAAQWVSELRTGEPSAESMAAWLEWAQADPENLAAFERVDAVAFGIASLPAQTKAQLLQQFAPAQRVPRSNTNRWAYSLAASLVLVVGAWGYWAWQSPQPMTATYVTGKAENRSYQLPDGTELELGAGTRVDVNYTASQRNVVLRDGEAFFKVAPDSRRPLAVHAGDLHITDIGTSFDVRKSGAHVMVTVSEGIVDVKSTEATTLDTPVVRLTAGQQIRTEQAAADLSAAKVASVNLDTAASWRNGRLDFQDETLAVVIANVNRYAAHEIVIVDPEVAQMRFTGTVFQNRTDAWLAATQHLFALRVESAADGRRLLYAVK